MKLNLDFKYAEHRLNPRPLKGSRRVCLRLPFRGRGSKSNLGAECVGLMMGVAVLTTACQPTSAPTEVQINNPQLGAVETPLPTRAVAPRTTIAADGSLVLATPLVVASFEANAKVTRVNVTPGQAVNKGDVLAELDSTQLNEDLTRAKEQLTLKENETALNLAPPKKGDLDSAKASLASAYARYTELKKGPAQSDIDQALHSWNQAKNSLNSQQLSRDAMCRIDPNTAIEKQNVDRNSPECKKAELEVQSSEINVHSAYEKYLDTQKPPTPDKFSQANADIASAKANVAKLQNGVSAEQRKVYDLQLAQTKLAVVRAQRNLAKVQLISPCACVVQDVNLTVGANASGTSITLLDVSAVQFRTTNLSERDVVQMQPGQAVSVRLKAYDQSFVGTVNAVLPLSSGTQGNAATFTVLVGLEPATVALLPGMTGQAEIQIKNVE